MGGSADLGREGGFNLGEYCGFKALLFEKYKPQMNMYELRYLINGEAN